MKDYRLFDIPDFVLDDDFIRWVSQGNNADNDFWDAWLARNSDKYMIVAEARRILELIGAQERTSSDLEKQGEISRLLMTISEQPYETQSYEPDVPAKVVSASKKWWYAAAATIIAVSLGVYFFGNRHKDVRQYTYAVVTSSKHLIENINTSEKAVTLRLPDESTVELAPNSRISYSNNFDSTRDIYLSGQAFFNVTKNPARPFRVFANEIVTKVLGTSFSIRCFERDTVIQVRVRTGKVSIYSQASVDPRETSSPNHLGGFILTPNQELVYKKSNQEFQKTLLENPVAIVPDAIDQKNMVYEEVSLEKVFDQLSKMYGINIVYDNELVKKCTVTADLRNETFYNKLDLICKAIGARYEVLDGQVVVRTNGCE